jgi:hypothetical protein
MIVPQKRKDTHHSTHSNDFSTNDLSTFYELFFSTLVLLFVGHQIQETQEDFTHFTTINTVEKGKERNARQIKRLSSLKK